MELTKTQHSIIDDVTSALLVTAPAGAGKTEVMARRAAAALQSGKKNILCLTFTNRAANSMKKRIDKLGGAGANTTVCTVHSFCNSLIRAESKSLGIPFGYTILDEEDSNSILREILLKSKEKLSDHDMKSARTSLDDLRNSKTIDKNTDSSDLHQRFKTRFSANLENTLAEYLHSLKKSNSLDFTSLITIAYSFLNNTEDLKRWQNIYDFIQVDEMQDIGVIEYEIISKLAHKHKNLSLFGDTDQTIYEWRDSRPFEILDKYRSAFSPKEYVLNNNFRSTKTITHCSETFLNNYFNRVDKEIEVAGPDGEKVSVCFLNNIDYERKQVCKIVSKLHSKNTSLGEIAILTRTNKDARNYSHALADAGIPVYIIDEFNFFRREEIKDAVSALKLLLNKRDVESAKRVLSKFAKNIGEKTIADIQNSLLPVSLEDFISNSNKNYEDLMEPIIAPYLNNNIVIFDVESTGLDTEKDDIIEIAAVRFGIDGVLDEYHHYLKNTIPVGASEAIHGYSDEFLLEAGKEPKSVLAEFLEFSKGCILAGHNVAYDIAILKSNLVKHGLEYNLSEISFDTLDGAKRILKDADDYKLGTLCAHFGIEEEPTHHAMDDVWATCELADICFENIIRSKEERIEFYSKYRDKFKAFSSNVERLEYALRDIRPDELLSKAIEKLEIKRRYKEFKNKQENLDELTEIFKAMDNKALLPERSLRKLIEIATLSNSSERQLSENKVAVLTVHQAKGLQFSSVIIANAVEGAFPSSLNIKYDKCDEEARLFYVAMTRASKSLFITLSAIDEYGDQNKSSRFIKYMPKECYNIFAQDSKKS